MVNAYCCLFPVKVNSFWLSFLTCERKECNYQINGCIAEALLICPIIKTMLHKAVAIGATAWLSLWKLLSRIHIVSRGSDWWIKRVQERGNQPRILQLFCGGTDLYYNFLDAILEVFCLFFNINFMYTYNIVFNSLSSWIARQFKRFPLGFPTSQDCAQLPYMKVLILYSRICAYDHVQGSWTL